MSKNMKPEVVFVDFFNTVVLRKLSPKDVIYRFCELLGEKYSIEPSALYRVFMRNKNRIAFERFRSSGDAEYTFREIASGVANEFGRSFSLNAAEFISDATQCYIEAEAQGLSLKAETIELLKSYKAEGARIVVLSDFYCKGNVIKLWLGRLGVGDLFDEVIVSCEYGCSKRSGRLYDKALSVMGVSARQALMIGDNINSDCRKARLHKIKCIHLKQKQAHNSKEVKAKIKHGARYEELKEIYGQCPAYKFTNYAFPLYLFEKRLCQRLTEERIKHVFFFAREGQFLKKLFEDYCRETGNGSGITAHYLYISRNSALLAGMRPLGRETFDKVFHGVLCVTLRKFLATLAFGEDEITTIAKQIGADPDRIYSDMRHSDMFVRLCANKMFAAKYDEMRRAQSENFRLYWESFGVDVFKEEVAVVDVGYSGTMQTLVERHFGGKAKIKGYYIGARDRSDYERTTKFGLLYARKNKTYRHNHLYHHNMCYYEQILRADHGRTIGYIVNDGVPQPVFDNIVDDKNIFLRDIEPMQDRIELKFRQICRLDYDNFSTMDDVSARVFYRISVRPTSKDMEWIMRCEDSHYDMFMRIGYTYTPYKHIMRYIVRAFTTAFFAVKNIGARKVRIAVPAHSCDKAMAEADEEPVKT